MSQTLKKAPKKVVLLIPNVPRYTLKYRKSDGRIKEYEISQPIERTTEGITSYSFSSHGIRTFLFNRMLDIELKS